MYKRQGQKFEAAVPTINARHSSKYFGLNKGVVSYTLPGNHVPLNARIIGANEHESHFVFDILFNNATDILPAIHSTDTDGTNHVNFALLYESGYWFAPRYRNVQRQVKAGLLGFRHPTHCDKNWPIRPNRRVREGLIISEEANIERILLSLALKSTTQSVIVGKLSAYRRKNRTKRALWELDGIIRTLYLLDYIYSPMLRRLASSRACRRSAICFSFSLSLRSCSSATVLRSVASSRWRSASSRRVTSRSSSRARSSSADFPLRSCSYASCAAILGGRRRASRTTADGPPRDPSPSHPAGRSQRAVQRPLLG